MRATINGRTYDTDKSEEVATGFSDAGDAKLYQTRHRDFFLVKEDRYLDGHRLAPSECIEDIAPELTPRGNRFGDPKTTAERGRRYRLCRTIIPVDQREAMIWCIKTQIPAQFRGYVLESV